MEINDYNAMISGWNFFDKRVKNDRRTYDSNRKITTGQGERNWLFTRLYLFKKNAR